MSKQVRAVSCGLVLARPDSSPARTRRRLSAVAADSGRWLFDIEIDDTVLGYERLVGELVRRTTDPANVSVVTNLERSLVVDLLRAVGAPVFAVDAASGERGGELPELAASGGTPADAVERAVHLAAALTTAGQLVDRSGQPAARGHELIPLLRAHWATARCRRISTDLLRETRHVEHGLSWGKAATTVLSDAVSSTHAALHQLGLATQSLAGAIAAELDDYQHLNKLRAIRGSARVNAPTQHNQITQVIPIVRRPARPARLAPSWL